MTTLDVTSLRSLVGVASFGGVRRAAEALHISQSGVSGHLRRLETELGFPIVTRQGRNIAFTSRGEDVLREAYRLLAAHDEALDRLAGPGDDELVMASTEQASEPMLRAVAQVLATRYPTRRLSLRFHRSARVREFVHEHTADVAIGFGDLGIGTVRVGDVPLTWFGAAAVDLSPTALVAFSAPCVVRDRMLSSPTAARARLVRECIDLTSLLAAVRHGVGITALPTTIHPVPGIAPVPGLTALPSVPLTLATGARIDDETRHELVTRLRTVWIGE